MPRPPTVTGADELPLWDTFEALFFLVAGLSVGLVLGILFPSLWRTFRRRFRNPEKFAPHDATLTPDIGPPVRILDESSPEEAAESVTLSSASAIPQAFVLARNFFQQGQAREAIRVYLEILGSEQVSKQQTNRALFELSQVYMHIGLQARAFETALELLHRKPEHAGVLNHLLELCMLPQFLDRVRTVVQIYRGNTSDELRTKIAHVLAQWAEHQKSEGKEREALESARQAVRWQMLSSRAKILLWQITSEDLWHKCGTDSLALWNALAADLEARWRIGQETDVSPSAGAKHLGKCLAHLSVANAPNEAFAQIREEFERNSGRLKLSPHHQRDFEWIIVLAALEVLSDPHLRQDAALQGIVKILAPHVWPGVVPFVVAAPDPGALWTGVLQTAFLSHKCKNCLSLHSHFRWKCVHCGALESLHPVLSANQSKTADN